MTPCTNAPSTRHHRLSGWLPGLLALLSLAAFSPVYAAPAGIDWQIVNYSLDLTWNSVAYGNGRFVAVAASGTGNRVMTSPDGSAWTIGVSAADSSWSSVTYGNGLFVAVANTGTGNRVMSSPDGITWTARASANDALGWRSVTYGGGLFVAVASSGTNNRVMTSPDGSTWTTQTSAADNAWTSVTYGNGLFAAVAADGAGNRIMTSSNGSAWTAQTYPPDQAWYAVTYGNGLFVAVACGVGVSQTCEMLKVGNRVMTSPDGFNWTARTTPAADSQWTAVTYGNALFVAVAESGTNQVMTSPDGIVWTAKTAAANDAWRSVTYGNGRFVAVAQTGTNQVMTSPDGTTWTAQTAAAAVTWYSVAYGNNRFVAVASGGTGTRVMTSPDGIAWTAYAAANDNLSWRSVTYGNGQFVAVGSAGAVMTSTDGSTWTTRTAAAAINWTSVTYGDGLFVAVASSGVGNRVMTSPDGVTWTARTTPADNQWTSVIYGSGLFVAVAWNGAGNRVMLSRNPCGAGIPLTTSPTALWQQLALPCVPSASPSTAGEVLGGSPTLGRLDAGIYNNAAASGWLMYGNDLVNNKNVKLGVTDTLTNGVGYWIKSFSAPSGGGNLEVTGTATPAPVSQADGCASANGCAAIAVTTVAGQDRYNLVGNPFPYNVDWAQVRVRIKNSGGTDIGTYTPSQAAGVAASGNASPPVLSNQIWIYNGTSYGTWTDVSLPPGNLKYFQSFWVKVLAAVAANGYTVELLIPAEPSTHAQVAPASGTELASRAHPWHRVWLDWLIPPAAADDAAGFAPGRHPAARPLRGLQGRPKASATAPP
uniref:hypothetical protein n=1 Tax=uncultured Lamprocystis sp. TaxID=543132 RepID=UPI0025CE5762